MDALIFQLHYDCSKLIVIVSWDARYLSLECSLNRLLIVKYILCSNIRHERKKTSRQRYLEVTIYEVWTYNYNPYLRNRTECLMYWQQSPFPQQRHPIDARGDSYAYGSYVSLSCPENVTFSQQRFLTLLAVVVDSLLEENISEREN